MRPQAEKAEGRPVKAHCPEGWDQLPSLWDTKEQAVTSAAAT